MAQQGRKPYRKSRKDGDKDSSRGKGRQQKDDRDEKSSRDSGTFNDFAWYNSNPALTVAAASIPFPYRPGMMLSYGSLAGAAGATTSYNTAIPGIFAIQWSPSLGKATEVSDPISVAAKQIYAKVRAAFSGELKADAPDYIMYLMALDSIFSAIGALKRIYRITSTYSPNNYYVPQAILRAIGVPEAGVADLVANKTQLFGYVNELVGMTKRFVCPAVFPVFNRHYWLNDNVYMDDSTMNAQSYVFFQNQFFRWSLENVSTGGQASGLSLEKWPQTMPTTGSYTTALFEFVRGLINALAESSDAYTISGYLMRAFDGASVFSVDELGMSEQFDPIYAPAVLQQIENAVAVGAESVEYVTQDVLTNTVLAYPDVNLTIDSRKTVPTVTPMLNIRSDSPTVEDVVEASRLATYFTVPTFDASDDGVSVHVITGTEFVEFFNLWTISSDGSLTSQQMKSVYNGGANNNPSPFWRSLFTTFDWHPRLIRVESPTSVVWDLHNVTTLSLDQMQQINKICLYSEFNSFSIG